VSDTPSLSDTTAQIKQTEPFCSYQLVAYIINYWTAHSGAHSGDGAHTARTRTVKKKKPTACTQYYTPLNTTTYSHNSEQ
jgi:hypothetical protein